MAAPFGNQNAKGNKGGVKKIYTPERLAIEAKALREWISQPRNMLLKDFAHERGYNPDRLAQFAKESIEFSSAYHYAKDMQEKKFFLGGWSKDMGMDFIKFFMPRILKDKPEWKQSWDQPEERADTPTTVIINKIEK